MGLSIASLHFIESSIEQAFGSVDKGLHMLELGNQYMRDPSISEKTGKAYFENRGFKHVSVDINGLDGALARDLTKPEQFQDLHESWDVLTNSGTTEHVEPFESQYECFGIIHDCLKVGGIAIHLIPDAYSHDEHGKWKNHCHYYYSEAFFELLASECGYELLSNTVINGLRCATVKKISRTPFMEDRAKFLDSIARREYDISPGQSRAGKFLKRIGLKRFLRRIGLKRFLKRAGLW